MDDFFKLLQGPTVTVRVGQGEASREFVVSKDLLCSNSKWFNDALKAGQFVESHTGTINMPDDIPGAFQAFHYFLISGGRLLWKDFALTEDNRAQYGEQLQLAYECWIFGDKYGEVELQHAAIMTACTFLTRATCNPVTISSHNLAAGFSKTMAGSPLRTITADYVATRMVTDADGASELLQALAPLDGFAKALQDSQGLLHHSRNGDFPRYFKPLKHVEQLTVVTSKESRDEPVLGHVGSHWTNCLTRCWECGYIWTPDKINMADGQCEHDSESQDFLRPTCVHCCTLGGGRAFKELAETVL